MNIYLMTWCIVNEKADIAILKSHNAIFPLQTINSCTFIIVFTFSSQEFICKFIPLLTLVNRQKYKVIDNFINNNQSIQGRNLQIHIVHI